MTRIEGDESPNSLAHLSCRTNKARIDKDNARKRCIEKMSEKQRTGVSSDVVNLGGESIS